MTSSQNSRTYGAAHFAFELGNKNDNVGFFHSIEGGGIKAEVKTHHTGNEHRDWSQIGAPKYEDIKIQVGMSMGEAFYVWIEEFFRGKTVRHDGAILAGDFHYRERARREMQAMLISEVTMPALDASNKNACHMGVTIVPERVVFTPGSKEEIKAANTRDKQKLWTSSNFLVRIDQFEAACRRVMKVDAFTIKTDILEHRVGNLRDAIRVPGRLELPTLSIHVPESDAEPFIKHFVAHTQDGKMQPSPRLTGEIEFRDHGGKGLCSVDMLGLDIVSVTPSKSEAKSDDVKSAKIEFSLEEIQFKWLKR